MYRIETNLGRIVIAYAERRRRITRGGKSTKVREVVKALRKLREEERKNDIVYKTARIIEEIAKENNAVVVVATSAGGARGSLLIEPKRAL